MKLLDDGKLLNRLGKTPGEMLPFCLLSLLIIGNIEVRLEIIWVEMLIWCLLLTNIIAGKLEKKAVLKAICSGFEETTEPAVCLSDGYVS